jgi:hypothetical protein
LKRSRRRRALLALTILALGLGVAACGDDDDAASAESVTVTLAELTDSGQSGTATLSASGSQTDVSIDLPGGAEGVEQPIHIHQDTCAELDPAPVFPLSNVADGVSETTIDVALEELVGGEFSINGHKSAEEAAIYVVCGEIS